MTTYTTYERDESGIVRRTHARVTLPARERVADYPHQERLRGWPERTVYWSAPAGYAHGVARA